VGEVESRERADLEELCEFAVRRGATRARPIDARKIVVDERVQLKCRYPPLPILRQKPHVPPIYPKRKGI
jgi:predicted metal-binding protein